MKLSIYKKIITSAIFTLLFISSVNFCNLLPSNPNPIDSAFVVFDNPLLDSIPKNESSPKNNKPKKNKKGIVRRTATGVVTGAKIGFKTGSLVGGIIGTLAGIVMGADIANRIKPQGTTPGITTICLAGGGIVGGILGKKTGEVIMGVIWAIQLAPIAAIASALDILPQEKSSSEEKK